jgi:hypothetical protein
MMQKLYTHLENWECKDKIATQELEWWTKPYKIQKIHQEQVAHCLKWMREVYFKKNWTIKRPSNGPSPVYIV